MRFLIRNTDIDMKQENFTEFEFKKNYKEKQ